MSDKICLRVGGMIRTMKRRKSPRRRAYDGPDNAGGSDRAPKKWGDAHGREVVGRGHSHRLSIQSAMQLASAMPPVTVAATAKPMMMDAARAMGQAASGRVMPLTLAAIRKWASRDRGIPMRRQLWTVEIGASIMRATALVPPSASMIVVASVFMR